MSSPYHARYFAHELKAHHRLDGVDRLSTALFDACVELNPHQIDAAAFALRSPLSKGVLLADEVGLGKTIEAGLVLCQYWAERKRRLLVICPASIRKQWSLELSEKFNLPNLVLDAQTYKQRITEGHLQPFSAPGVVITSMHFASRMRDEIRGIPFDLVVIDEAHKLRNAYRPSNKMGQGIKWAVEERKKLLVTATPLQNSLMELYGLSSVLDDMIFGDPNAYRAQYGNSTGNLDALRERVQHFCQRTLRRQVIEYIQYTERRPLTFQFRPTDDEHKLYEAVSEYLKRDNTFAFPKRQRHLTTLIIHKLLASSSRAVANTLEALQARLIKVRDGMLVSDDMAEFLIHGEELEDELLDEILGTEDDPEAEPPPVSSPTRQELVGEIDELNRYAQWARSIGIDTKSRSLLKALGVGFDELAKMNANRKALIFTESRRTQEYLKNFLETNGYAGQVVLFNGTNSDPESRAIIDKWLTANAASGRVVGSRAINSRTALIEHFRDNAAIMIATEAAAEGVNLQFCSLVVNYDLPWNPQRIEQRIGRCHRYGQKHDVVVINFLNERNEADLRVQELLAEKFKLFSGVFGASDEVLGSIESGVDFERRILAIYQTCRTPEQIESAFRQLQQEMDATIKARIDDTRRVLLEQFDEDVHARLKTRMSDAEANLDRIGRNFWSLTQFVLFDRATFNDTAMTFDLHRPPPGDFRIGTYHLISKSRENLPGDYLYRLSHPLGEWTIEQGQAQRTPPAKLVFDVSNYPVKLSMIEALKGSSGWLTLQHLIIESFEREDCLLFSAFTDAGKSLDQETCEKLFNCLATVLPAETTPGEIGERLQAEAKQHAEAAVARSLETNNQLFNEQREQLDKWADDMTLGAEKELRDTKEQIKALRRQARLAPTLDEQNELQNRLRDLEKKQRRQRQQIFAVEDEIIEKRDRLIAALQKRMVHSTTTNHLFTIRWEVA